MAKKKKLKPQRELTRRQLTRWQQQKKRQRIIFTAGMAVIVAVVGVVGIAWFIKDYYPRHQTVITVNDTKYNMNYYLKMLEIYGTSQPDQVIEVIEQNELIRQAALALEPSISVSKDEINKKLKSSDPPLSNDFRDLVATSLLLNKLRDEYFEQKVPTSAEQRQVKAMFLESKKQATEIKARLDDGEDFTKLATELSLESITKGKGGDLGWHPQDIFTEQYRLDVPAEYAFNAEAGALSEPIYDETQVKNLGYWLIEVLSRREETEEVHVQAILLGNEDEALEVKGRLEDGEEFSALAEEYTQDETSRANGGDLGWLTSGEISEAFNKFAFNPEVELNRVSQPIRDDAAITTGGWWLVKVEAIEEDRKIDDNDRSFLKSKAMEEWIESLKDNPENIVDHSYLDDAKKEWAINKVTGS